MHTRRSAVKSPGLIVFDLDGTLLQSNKSIPAHTCQVLTECKPPRIYPFPALYYPVRKIRFLRSLVLCNDQNCQRMRGAFHAGRERRVWSLRGRLLPQRAGLEPAMKTPEYST
ncbi:MAG: HAD hydrolase family protein [Coriobacteriales bacterium]|nr:HAD hydrolase family protein [Coriobacteriales bacterium]